MRATCLYFFSGVNWVPNKLPKISELLRESEEDEFLISSSGSKFASERVRVSRQSTNASFSLKDRGDDRDSSL